jgi:hypothetical protein
VPQADSRVPPSVSGQRQRMTLQPKIDGPARAILKRCRLDGSDRGALPGLLLVGFPGPPAAPGVRLSPHRALRVPAGWFSR